MNIDDLGFDPACCFIANQWLPARSGEVLALHDPSTGEALCSIARGSALDIDVAVEQAESALDSNWGRMTAPERGSHIVSAWPVGSGKCRSSGAPGIAGCRQAAETGKGRCCSTGKVYGVLRRRGRQNPWQHDSLS